MKKLISVDWDKDWRHIGLSLRGSRCWSEFRLGFLLGGCGGLVREDESKCSSVHLSLSFLWWYAAIWLWI